MMAPEVKVQLAKAASRCWPNVAKASDLPFPDYWRAVTEWLTFHAPHIGDDALMWKLIDNFAASAREAEERGETPASPKIPDEVREIWNRAAAAAAQEAWEHAAERAEEVRSRFAGRRARTLRETEAGSEVRHPDDNLEGKINAFTGSAQRSILTDRSKTSTCGDRPERRPCQGRLL